MRILVWTLLFLVFVDEVLAVAVAGWWGWHQDPRWIWVWLLPAVATTAWALLASPKAPYGGPVVRPLAKVAVFGLACLALWHLDRPGLAVALLAFSVVVNALALLPAVTRVLEEQQRV